MLLFLRNGPQVIRPVWPPFGEMRHDVYLVDYHLGAQTGLSLMQSILAEEGIIAPFILLTGQGDHEVAIQAMELGAADFIVKGEFTGPMLERALLYAVRHAQTLHNLRLSENRYLGVIDSQTEMICRISPDLTLTFVNEAYCRYFKRTREQLIGQSFLMLLPEKDHERARSHVEEVGAGGCIAEYEYESTSGDQVTWQRWTDQPIYDANGNFLELQAVGIDITDRKLAETALKSALQKERELNELKSRFVSTASHEFRTPLTMILSTASYLEMACNVIPYEKSLQKLKKIQDACGEMTTLLDEVLVYAKGDANRIDFQPKAVDVVPFCLELVEDLNANHGKTNISVQVPNETAVQLDADEKLLRQILTNLLTNAVKYSPDAAEVEFEIGQTPSEVVFVIRDFGIGIPEKDQARLFEPFHRAANVRNISGTGLGLAITKNAVDLHNGNISFSSKRDHGTTFAVHLPINQQPMQTNTIE